MAENSHFRNSSAHFAFICMEFASLRLTVFGAPPGAGESSRKETIMRKRNRLVAAGIAGSLLLATAGTSFALPVASNHQAVSEAAPAPTTNVRWHGRWHGGWHRGWGWGLGAAAVGLGIAAATAPYYYGPGPYYYGAYDPYYGGCWRDRWGRVWCR
jgi:hypothetical protein